MAIVEGSKLNFLLFYYVCVCVLGVGGGHSGLDATQYTPFWKQMLEVVSKVTTDIILCPEYSENLRSIQSSKLTTLLLHLDVTVSGAQRQLNLKRDLC